MRKLDPKKLAVADFEPLTSDEQRELLQILPQPEKGKPLDGLAIALRLAVVVLGKSQRELCGMVLKDTLAFCEAVEGLSEGLDRLDSWSKLCEATRSRLFIALQAAIAVENYVAKAGSPQPRRSKRP